MKKRITRKEFFNHALGIVGATLGLGALAGCGDDDDDGGENGTTGGTGGSAGSTGGSAAGAGGSAGGTGGVSMCTSDVAEANAHTHQVIVPAADVEAGAEMTYMLSDVGHVHTITLSADDMMMLAGGGTVTLDSSMDDAHRHSVTVMCE